MLPSKYGNHREEQGDPPGTQNHKQGSPRGPSGRVGKGFCRAEISVHCHHEQGPDGGIQCEEINGKPRVAKIP